MRLVGIKLINSIIVFNRWPQNAVVIAMQFLEEIWKLLFLAPMPWQLVLAIVVTFVFIPCIAVKIISWLIIKLTHLVLFVASKIVTLLFYIEGYISQFARKINNNELPAILYLSDDTLDCLRIIIDFLLSSVKSLSPKKWHSLPFVAAFIYFSYQYHYADILFDNTATWWRVLNKYTYYTVGDGDCLSKIAQKYHVPKSVIISENKDRYPTLIYNQDEISTGWKLKIPRYYSSEMKKE